VTDDNDDEPVRIPIHGKASHNSAFLVSIGELVVSWANSESVFLAMLQLLIQSGGRSAAIIWHSHRTTLARLELIDRLSRERVSDEQLVRDIRQSIVQFKGFSKTRNFYCHALYDYDADLCLRTVSSATNAQQGEPLRFERKRMDKSVLNEIGDAIIRLGEFNRSLWKLVERLQDALGERRIELPQLLQQLTENQDAHPHSDEAQSPRVPPEPSQG